ncbi:MAG: hypothetical protein KGV43_01435 [Arcobacter sp.]|nr:hypothetical protein [Arcobacter sp.]
MKRRDSLIQKGIISYEEYKKTRDIFISNPKDRKIRPHKINCKKGINIISLTIVNTQVRILLNMKKCENEEVAIFSWIGKYKEYEKIIKDKRNCKNIFVDCEQIQN